MAGGLSDPVTSLFCFGCEYGPLPSWIWTPFQTPSLRGNMDLFQVVDRGHAHDAERVMPVLSSKFRDLLRAPRLEALLTEGLTFRGG